MNPLLIGGGVVALILIIYLVSKKSTPKTKPSDLIFDKYSEHGKEWVKMMYDMYIAGLTWDKKPILIWDMYEKKFGISLELNQYGVKYNAYQADLGISKNYLEMDESTLAFKLGDFYMMLDLYLSIRFQYQYEPLRGKNSVEVMSEYGLNLDSNEVLYYSTTKVDWYEQNTISTNVSYGGFRYRSGGHMSFSTGTFNIVKNNVTGFVLLDRGSLYITNKRIIFIGGASRENRTLNFSNILEYEIFKDGILLGKENGKKPLIFFAEAINTLLQPDMLNPVIRILDRILSETTDEDLTPESFKTLD